MKKMMAICSALFLMILQSDAQFNNDSLKAQLVKDWERAKDRKSVV